MMKQITIGRESRLGCVVLFVGLAVFSFRFLAAGPEWLLSGAGVALLGLGAFLSVLLLLSLVWQRPRAPGLMRSHLRPVLAIWWSLLVSEEIFSRNTPEPQSFAGRFSEAAYAEAVFWMVAFSASLVLARPQHLRQAFSAGNRWLTLFAVVCLASAPFSPTPLYSLAWAFKLVLVVLLLVLTSTAMHTDRDVESFLWSNLWGFALLSLVALVRALANPTGAFEDGRLYGSPNGLSITTGVLVLLALTLYTVRRRRWLVGFAVFGATVMIMSGGKAGIAAGIVSVMAFFVLQRRFAASFGWLWAMIAIAGLVLATTPLASHFTTYQQEGHLSNISGRTDLWQAVWPEILQRPFVGHGYLASRFVSEAVAGAFSEAGHLHNGFIDTVYNTGLAGLTVLIMMHGVILRNLWRSLRNSPGGNERVLVVGCCALYVNLFINGEFNSTFGGAARPPFMMLLGLLAVTEKLRVMSRPSFVPMPTSCASPPAGKP